MLLIVRRIPFLFIALVAYYLPWLYHKSAVLTANAYDLAEQISLHTSVRYGNPPLVAPFLLRAALAGLAVLFALQSFRSTKLARWLYGGFSVVLAVTILPPLDFFRGRFDDPNQQQQFILALGTAILLAVLVFAHNRNLIRLRWLDYLVIVVTVVMAIVGEVLAWNVIQSLRIIESIGGGIILFVLALVGQFMNLLIQQRSAVKS
jgi:hypothetical protein